MDVVDVTFFAGLELDEVADADVAGDGYLHSREEIRERLLQSQCDREAPMPTVVNTGVTEMPSVLSSTSPPMAPTAVIEAYRIAPVARAVAVPSSGAPLCSKLPANFAAQKVIEPITTVANALSMTGATSCGIALYRPMAEYPIGNGAGPICMVRIGRGGTPVAMRHFARITCAQRHRAQFPSSSASDPVDHRRERW